MSRTLLSSLTLLLVASLGTVAEAQGTAIVPPPDSVAADSVAPKKTGRFGGLMKKAKKVAANKQVQNAAKGVACTVVPGAAISAAANTGPCAGAGLMGSVTGAAAAMALGSASNAGAQAMAMKMMKTRGNGVSSTATALAAMKMMQGQGISNGVAAASMAAMMQNPAAAGMSVTDVAAVMKMIQGMGMSAAALSAPASIPTAAKAAEKPPVNKQ
jgi:hypothetical protein